MSNYLELMMFFKDNDGDIHLVNLGEVLSIGPTYHNKKNCTKVMFRGGCVSLYDIEVERFAELILEVKRGVLKGDDKNE